VGSSNFLPNNFFSPNFFLCVQLLVERLVKAPYQPAALKAWSLFHQHSSPSLDELVYPIGQKGQEKLAGAIASLGTELPGRIGRLVCRAVLGHEGDVPVAVNDPFLSLDNAANLFQYDSVLGNYAGTVTADAASNFLIIEDGNTKSFIKFFAEKNPSAIPWASVGASYACEPANLGGGAKKVIISAPSADAPMYVVGVNHKNHDGSADVYVLITISL
jgi:hypothetical protein